MRQLGHFGFFRPRFRTTLWADARDWLLSTLPPAPAPPSPPAR